MAIRYPAPVLKNICTLNSGKSIFGVNDADQTIGMIEDFFKSIGSPVRLQEAGIEEKNKALILSTMIKNKVNGSHHKLSADDLELLTEFMFHL